MRAERRPSRPLTSLSALAHRSGAALRRLGGTAALATLAAGMTLALPGHGQAQQAAPAAADFTPAFGQAQPFSFDLLAARAEAMARAPYAPPVVAHPDLFDKITYDVHWRIRFRPETTVTVGDVPVQFFHLGTYFRSPVAMNVVENGQSRQVIYDTGFFDMPADSPARAIEGEAGFAGFRLMRPDLKTDWISFLGGAYFRTDGALHQYGLSARGIALDTGLSTPEEFPRFTEFFVEKSADPEADAVIYALMDGPRVTGAYRMVIRNREGEGQVMDIATRLYFRAPVERLGIGPLTSMFWYSETNRVLGFDWRPEVHDTDGLMMIAGNGEQIWRPLNNPPRVVTSSFYTTDPKGFGLIQRDRAFENYQDDGVFYDRRPAVWVQPEGAWGPGAVQLVEIPTDDEIYDNIVAFWNPERKPQAGDALALDYKLYWGVDAPVKSMLGRTVASRIGAGGVPGQPRPPGQLKVVIDFEGPALKGLGQQDGVEPQVSLPEGVELLQAYALPVVGTDRWRLIFDLKAAPETDTLDIRAYLARDGVPLTETWLGQLHPAQFSGRR